MGIFSNVPDGFIGALFGISAFVILCCAFLFILTQLPIKEKKNKSLGCGTPLIIILIISIIIGIVGAYSHGMSPEEAKEEEEYRENRKERADEHTVKCPICERSFRDDSDNAKSIKWNGMCTQCYKNYKYANDLLKEMPVE